MKRSIVDGYISTKEQLDELVTELMYHRYNNAKLAENKIRLQKCKCTVEENGRASHCEESEQRAGERG